MSGNYGSFGLIVKANASQNRYEVVISASRSATQHDYQAGEDIPRVFIRDSGNYTGPVYPAMCITKDELTTYTDVMIVDIDNQRPAKAAQIGGALLRLVPNTGVYPQLPNRKWRTPQDLVETGDGPASAVLWWAFAHPSNPRWQNEYPLFRKGTCVKKFNTGDPAVDNKYIEVTLDRGLYGPHGRGVKIVRGRGLELVNGIWVDVPLDTVEDYGQDSVGMPVNYMHCDAKPFRVGDRVVVQYSRYNTHAPTVIGFWTNPRPCYEARLLCMIGNDNIGWDYGVWPVGADEAAWRDQMDIEQKRQYPTTAPNRRAIFKNWQPVQKHYEMLDMPDTVGFEWNDLDESTTCSIYSSACDGCTENVVELIDVGSETYKASQKTLAWWLPNCDDKGGYPSVPEGDGRWRKTRKFDIHKDFNIGLLGSRHFTVQGSAWPNSPLVARAYSATEVYQEGHWEPTRGYGYISAEQWMYQQFPYIAYGFLNPEYLKHGGIISFTEPKIITWREVNEYGTPYQHLPVPFTAPAYRFGDAIWKAPMDVNVGQPHGKLYRATRYTEDATWQIWVWSLVRRSYTRTMDSFNVTENKEHYLINWYEQIDSDDDLVGTLSLPPNATLYMNAFDGEDVVCSKMQDGLPANEQVTSTNGRLVEVSIQPDGSYEFVNTPRPDEYPVAIVYTYHVLDEHINYDYVLPSENELRMVQWRYAFDGERTEYSEKFEREFYMFGINSYRPYQDPKPAEQWIAPGFTDFLNTLFVLASNRQEQNGTLDDKHCLGGTFETYIVDYSSSSSMSSSFSSSSRSSASCSSSSSSYPGVLASSYSSSSSTSISSSSESSSSSSYGANRHLETEKFIKRINAYRAAIDIQGLVHNEELTMAARRHARDMADNQHSDHYGTDGTSPEDRIRQAGYMDGSDTWVIGENIAWGVISEEEAFETWRDSPPHNDAMLNDKFFEMGLWWTINNTSGVIYWCLTFGQHVEHKCTIER